jgi:hypothetical protein
VSQAFPLLRNLFEAYFHADWDLDDPTWQSVVTRYLSVNREAVIAAATHELDELLSISDERIESLLFEEWQTGYNPEGDGMSTREWLKLIRKRFAATVGLNA